MYTPYDLQINRKEQDVKYLRNARGRLKSAQDFTNRTVNGLDSGASGVVNGLQVDCSAKNATSSVVNALSEYVVRLNTAITNLERELSTLDVKRSSFIREKQEELRRKAMEEVQ